jgi:hypothetical protein
LKLGKSGGICYGSYRSGGYYVPFTGGGAGQTRRKVLFSSLFAMLWKKKTSKKLCRPFLEPKENLHQKKK